MVFFLCKNLYTNFKVLNATPSRRTIFSLEFDLVFPVFFRVLEFCGVHAKFSSSFRHHFKRILFLLLFCSKRGPGLHITIIIIFG